MTSGNARRGIIEPWHGSGWPVDLFEDKAFLEEKGVYFCSRSECGINNRRIVREPWQLNCGHRVCKECHDILRALPEDLQRCEACRKELINEGNYNSDKRFWLASGHDFFNKDGMSYDAVPPSTSQQPSLADEIPTELPYKIDFSIAMKDNAAYREISRFLVICPYGCDTPTKLTLRTLERHMEVCPERQVPCEKCAEVIKHSERAEHTTKSCPFRIVECPNKCGVAGLRAKELAQHLNECENKPPVCNICGNSFGVEEDSASHLMKCVAYCPLNCGEVNMTTTSGNARRGIEPWHGSGWPVDLFEDKAFLEEKGVYFCSRSECGINNRRIVREPWQLNCGHRVCKECHDILRALPEDLQRCEACRKELFDEGNYNPDKRLRLASGHDSLNKDRMSYDAVPPSTSQQPSLADEIPTELPYKIDFSIAMKDNAAHRKISRLLVICPYGCDTPTKLTLGTLESCPFRIVECPNKCGVAGLRAKELAQHLNECENKPPVCNICQNSFGVDEDAASHLMKCVAYCPLNCGENKKVHVVKHLSEGKRMDQHLRFIKAELRTTTAQSSSGPATVISQSQLSDLQKRLLTLENQSDRADRMLMDKVHHMTPEMAKGLMENVQLAQRNRQDINDLNYLFKTVAQDVHKLKSYEAAFRALTEKISKTENETTERLNRLETLSNIRVAEIEDQKTLLNQLQMTSYNGHLLWKITDVQKHRDEAATRHSIYSHPFYTETYGYKMCARVFFNGDGSGKNSHISLFFVVMKGEYDALPTWPFQQKVTMKLRNVTKNRPDIVEEFRPEPSSSSFQRPKNEMNIASGCPQFAEQAHVFNPDNGFVVDDTMYVDIMVTDEPTAGLNSPQHVYDNEDFI